ncbi:ribbon-helix-helix protein, CopG family [Candidatus Bathyarchaeota archaeon]|nr:ribbon-helix-helix protein, CopG family [Candidatus Bathyarchaeota archaeon]
MVKAYANIKLPEELVKEVDKLIKNGTLGYRSRGEFVAEATRKLIMEIKSVMKE